MSTRKDGKSTHPNAPVCYPPQRGACNVVYTRPPPYQLSSEPHGISFTLMEPTPPNSPNLGGSFQSSQTKQPTKSKLSGSTTVQVTYG
ncbi:hypothetical protein BV20DRAFT_960701 [Pilatotrama ljubarskyi]|nr:hypothetical protein BV20DRAFT_960701 [Pilatotrama ljubarskyi]